MRESRLYLKFLQENLLFILAPAVIFLLMVFLFQKTSPVVYVSQAMFEMAHDRGEIAEKVLLADQVVTVIRSENLKKSLGVGESSLVQVFKPGPLAINLTVTGVDVETSRSDLAVVSGYLRSRYDVSEVGEVVISKVTTANYQMSFYAFLSGLALGLFLVLVNAYFKNF